MPMVLAMLASLVSAALLAWHSSKPIRTLRAAFDAASTGNLETRVGPTMGGRRDDLADLGRDFDRMAGQLQTLMDGQRRLLHDVSHELRSPLARLQAAIGLARRPPSALTRRWSASNAKACAWMCSSANCSPCRASKRGRSARSKKR
jgi:two-component system OmpR family sensor kinase